MTKEVFPMKVCRNSRYPEVHLH